MGELTQAYAGERRGDHSAEMKQKGSVISLFVFLSDLVGLFGNSLSVTSAAVISKVQPIVFAEQSSSQHHRLTSSNYLGRGRQPSAAELHNLILFTQAFRLNNLFILFQFKSSELQIVKGPKKSYTTYEQGVLHQGQTARPVGSTWGRTPRAGSDQ